MKNAKMTIVAVLVALVAVTTYSVGGTYAKYTDTFTGTSDSARVAKWAIDLKDSQNGTLGKTFTFDLFKTILDSDGSAETDVATGLIAPGTKGETTLKLQNNSEVNAEFKVKYYVTNANNIPLEFSSDNGATWSAAPTDPTTAIALDSTVINASAGEAEVKLMWRWSFTGNGDDVDTSFGVKGTDVVQVVAEVIVDQVD